MNPLRLGVVRAYRAEGWPSMDLCADQLLSHLSAIPQLQASDLTPPFIRRFTRIPWINQNRSAFNADRIVNRHFDLLRHLKRQRDQFDWFHIADHSYAMAAHALPAGRFGVYCHDLDAFRCLLEPALDPRPWWFRRLAQRLLDGLRLARVVFHNSWEVGRCLRESGLVPVEKLVHAPLGVAEEFTCAANASPSRGRILLHVGSAVPRKRVKDLLDVFAAVHARFPDVRLVQIGEPWPRELVERMAFHGFASAVERKQGLRREELAELYRQAAVVLVPSAAEGFGLPVVEALACGTPVIASDIPVLREVGGPAVLFRPVGDIASWADAVGKVLADPTFAPPRAARLAHAASFSWAAHVRAIAATYLRLDGREAGDLERVGAP